MYVQCDKDLGPSEDYYLFSDALPEDKELRQQLQRRRLVRERERERGLCMHNVAVIFLPGGYLGGPTS